MLLKFKNLNLFFLYFIFLYNLNKIKSINKIINDIQHPLIFDVNDEYYGLIAQGKYFIFYKENDTLKLERNINMENGAMEYEPPFLFFQQSWQDTYTLLTESYIYLIYWYDNFTVSSKPDYSPIKDLYKFFGFIPEFKIFSGVYQEVSIFGKKDKEIYFFYFSLYQARKIIISINQNIKEYLSCKI